MYLMKKLLQTEIPRWPFKAANIAIVPIGIMIAGCCRVWATANTPFEEFSGVLLVIAVALLWAICFGVVLVASERQEADSGRLTSR